MSARYVRTLLPLRALCILSLAACSTWQKAMAPALPPTGAFPRAGPVPDSVLRRAIHKSELIVLATPVELVSQYGFLTAQFQLGAKETWYDVKLVVDSVLKGKLKRAKHPDLGMLPAVLTPPPAFSRLAANEIVVQYPVVTSSRSDWAAAAPLVTGERAVFIFRRCYYCLPITGRAYGRGPYYKANPLVAVGQASKLPPHELSRVSRLLAERGRR
jgi:hypothetical protein